MKACWIVAPNMQTVQIYESKADGFVTAVPRRGQGLATSELLEGFSIDRDDLF